jgi:hypothetical protein
MNKSMFSDSQIMDVLNLLVESIMAFRKIKLSVNIYLRISSWLFPRRFTMIRVRRFAVGGESTRFEDMACRRQMSAGQEYWLNSGQGLEANVIGYTVGKCIAALSAGISFVL